jgi:hypothetical protein
MSSDPKREIYGKFANAGIPRNYVINALGIVVYHSCGYSLTNYAKMIDIITAELRFRDKLFCA